MRGLVNTIGFYTGAAIVTIYTAMGVQKTGGTLPILFLVPLLLLLLPPSRTYIKRKLGFIPSGAWTVGIVLVIWFPQMMWFAEINNQREAARQAQANAAAAKKGADLMQQRLENYQKNKPTILAKIEELVTAGKGIEALHLANQHWAVTKDPDLGRVQFRAEIAAMREEISTGENSIPETRRMQIYETLAKEPGQAAEYLPKLRQLQDQLAQKKKIEEQTRQREANQASIRSQFSGWDGSHRQVEAAVKAQMKNPGSYEHVETRYSVGENTITVITTFRGTNSFGATVPNTAVAEVALNGTVLSLRTK